MSGQSRPALVYFLDSSALVKRHLVEVGSGWVGHLTAPGAGNVIAIAHIGIVEVASAFAARLRSRFITAELHDVLLRSFVRDADQQYSLVPTSQSVIGRAMLLTARRKLRAYDAVQLASALIANEDAVKERVGPLVFVSADDRLLLAAEAEGLTPENPNRHPEA